MYIYYVLLYIYVLLMIYMEMVDITTNKNTWRSIELEMDIVPSMVILILFTSRPKDGERMWYAKNKDFEKWGPKTMLFFLAGCYIEDSCFRSCRCVTVLYRAWYELQIATTGGATPERVDFAENKRVVSPWGNLQAGQPWKAKDFMLLLGRNYMKNSSG